MFWVAACRNQIGIFFTSKMSPRPVKPCSMLLFSAHLRSKKRGRTPAYTTFASERPTAEQEAVATPSDAAEPDARSAPVVQDDARVNIAAEADSDDVMPSGPVEAVEMEELLGDPNVPCVSSLTTP